MKKVILFIVLTLFTGCAYKVTPETVYIKPAKTKLNVYEINSNYDFGELTNKGQTVCIKKWNVCIPKDEFKGLTLYIIDLKSVNDKNVNQIKIYNESTE